MGDLHRKKYQRYSGFKDPKTAVSDTSNSNSEPNEKLESSARSDSRDSKRNEDVPAKHFSGKQTLYADRQFKQNSNSLEESQPFQHGINVGKSSAQQRTRDSPKHHDERSNFNTQNSKPCAVNGLSAAHNSLENKYSRSPKKKIQMTSEEELEAMMRNILDTIKSPNESSVKLPKPPYNVCWSSLFQRCNFPRDVIALVKDREFKDYVDQPSHKKGSGLYYGEFEDLPPRFQKKAEEAVARALLARGLPVPDQEINHHQSTPNMPERNIESGPMYFVEGNKSGTIGTEISKIPPGLKMQDNLVLENMKIFDERRCLSSKSEMEGSGNSQKSKSDAIENVFRMLKGEGKLSDNQSKEKLLFSDISIQNQSLEISSDNFQMTNSLSKDSAEKLSNVNKQKKPSNFQDHKSSSNQKSRSPFHQKSKGPHFHKESKTPNFHQESRKPHFDEVSRKSLTISAPKSNVKEENDHTGNHSMEKVLKKVKEYGGKHATDRNFSNVKDTRSSPDVRVSKQLTKFPPAKQKLDVNKPKNNSDAMQKEASTVSDSGTSKLSQDSEFDAAVQELAQINECTESSSNSKTSVCDEKFAKTLRLKVLSQANNVEYWNSYVSGILSHDNFKVLNPSSVMEIVHVSFFDVTTAERAYCILSKLNGNHNQSQIVKVSTLKKHNQKCQFDITRLLRVHQHEISKLYEDYLMRHVKKMHNMEDELLQLKSKPLSNRNGKFNNEEESLQDNLSILEEMKCVFKKCYDNVNNSLNSASSEILLKDIVKLQNNFRHECNFLEGSLPIYSKKDEIIEMIRKNQVTILVAETGSGKSTQLVQYLLQAGFAEKGKIVCTQPRKIAAISLARYISGLLGSRLGQEVGYETGLTAKVSKCTKIVYMTDYTLLKRFVRKQFEGVSCVIVDEAHERSLYTDLLLGLIKGYLPKHKDFKVVITSATINPTVFLEYFEQRKKYALLTVPGRIYPVDVRWQNDDAFIGWSYLEATVKKVYEVHCQSEDGGILAFLVTPAETEEAIDKFHKFKSSNRHSAFKPKLMSLHGKLDTETQLQIFAPAEKGYRKIIFSTNSAETSITVPGIKFVVDCGMAKERKYDFDRKRSVLVIGFVNRSSADQRKGRAGRTQPGICYRMYSKKNFENDMSENMAPEILRVNLQQALLEILHLKIEPVDFDFICRPPDVSIEEAMESLKTLGAVNNKQVTELGKKIVKIPLEPQLAKLTLRGLDEGIGYECVIVAAMTTVSGRVFVRPEDDKQAADRKKLQFCIDEGDFHTSLWVYMQWVKLNEHYRDEWCLERYINPKAMKMAEQLVNELCTILTGELNLSISKFKLQPCIDKFRSKFEDILFDCFSENLCVFSGHEKSGYVTPYLEGSFFIHPSSAVSYLGQKMPMFIIYSSILKTSRPFLINVCPIKESTIVKAHQAGKFSLQIDLLKQLQILPRIIRPIGSLVLSKYIRGRNCETIREIEETIQSTIGTNSFYLDVNVAKGEIVTYIEQQHQKTVNEVLSLIIKKAHADLAKEEIMKEEMIRNSSVPYSYSLTCGGEVKDILLPGEFKEISIECRASFCNIPKLVSDLEEFDIVSYCETTSPRNKKILALFPKVACAQRALNFLKLNRDYIVSGKPHIVDIMEKPIPLFVIKASWIRLPCKGTGWIDLYNSEDTLTACFQLTTHRLCIDDQYIVIEPSKKGSNSVYMYHLPPLADENDIKETVEKRLHDFNIRVKKVTLVRDQSLQVTDSDISYMRKQLSRNFSPYTSSPKNLIIHIPHPKQHDMKWKAVLNFTDLEDGEKAMMELKGRLRIDDCKVDLKAVLKFSLYCRHIVFDLLQKDIEIFGRKYEKNKKCKDFLIEPKNETLMSISFVCDKIVDLFEVRKELVELTKGCFIDCSDNKDLLNLLSHNMMTSIREIETNFQTLILTDCVKKSIIIYGTKPSCIRTENEIQSLAKAFSRVQKKVYNLQSDSMPSGFLKTLYNRYGFSLKSFIKHFHLRHASINVLRHELILRGLPKRLAEAESHLEEICAELQENNENEKKLRRLQQNETQIEICPICFDETSADSVRLEHCGHAICKPCLRLQLQSEVFPIVCAKKDCEKLFFVQDLRNIVANDDELKKQVAEAALKHFVSANPQAIHYCPTPNCPMVYRVNTADIEFKCPCCENDLCTMCHCLYHHGMSCEMYQNSQRDSDHSLKVWVKKDMPNRKKCSTCNATIEKDGGCNHVICASCKSHMCWLCLRTFGTNDEVYAHIPFCENAAT